MKELSFNGGRGVSVLCLGAHADDIEIGVGGTILSWIASGLALDVHWYVMSADGVRREEARKSAADFLSGAQSTRIELGNFRDGYFPYEAGKMKEWLDRERREFDPDVVFTHTRGDAHQDHREVCSLTWNLYRNQMILEYEVPKWDGDVGHPNMYCAITKRTMERKIELLLEHFPSQRSKDWFDPNTFRGVARLRGMECRAEEHYAEAFVLRKGRIGRCDFRERDRIEEGE